MLYKTSSAKEEYSISNGPEVEYNGPAIILQYIDIVMIVGSFMCAIIIDYLGRCYRTRIEQKSLSPPDPVEQRGLVTEQGVNLMLEIGRRESERMFANAWYERSNILVRPHWLNILWPVAELLHKHEEYIISNMNLTILFEKNWAGKVILLIFILPLLFDYYVFSIK